MGDLGEKYMSGVACKIRTVEMSFLRGSFSVNRMDGDSNENLYGKFAMSIGRRNELWNSEDGQAQLPKTV